MPAFTRWVDGQACIHLHPTHTLRSSDLSVQGICNPSFDTISKIYFYERALIHIPSFDSISAN